MAPVMAASTTTRTPIAASAAYRPMLIQETIFAAVTMPAPVTQPLLTAISRSALLAKTKAMIAGITGHTTHAAMDSTSATMAELEFCGVGP